MSANCLYPEDTLGVCSAYIDTLNDDYDYKTIAIRALLIFIASSGCVVPRQYQLELANAITHGLDCVVDFGTGSSKILCQS